jgi:hypothetical protein
LNWEASSRPVGTDFVIESDSFENATNLIKMDGTAADPGWYRVTDVNLDRWIRRYWDGVLFEPYGIIENYVKYSGEFIASSAVGTSTCSVGGTKQHIYYSTDEQGVENTSGIYYLSTIVSENGKVLVNKIWSDVSNGSGPLLQIKKQNKPNSGSTFSSLLEDNEPSVSNRSNINNDSTLGHTVACS